MANASAIQNIQDGNRNAVVKLTGVLDTSNQASTTVVDVSALIPAAAAVLVERIDYDVSSQLAVKLSWDATTDDVLATLTGQGNMCFDKQGGLNNPRSTGWNGDILLETTGWASGIQTYTIVLTLRKQGVTA